MIHYYAILSTDLDFQCIVYLTFLNGAGLLVASRITEKDKSKKK
jgi:hypothetical protein